MSRYDKGVTCGCCGRKLDPGDAYSVYPRNQNKAICMDCDSDKRVDDEIERLKEG